MRKTIFMCLAALATIGTVFASKGSCPADPIFLTECFNSGLVPLTNGDDMFYWLFKSRSQPSTDPVVLWLTGGPGCASEVALFYENGPYTIEPDLDLKNNPYSWNAVSNLLFVDQPVGTGFSKCASIFDFDTNEDQIAATMKLFIDGFLEKNPEYKGRDFYITGESYAGHYIPALAYHFVKEIPPGSLGMNFKGIAIGNGWVDPYIQYPQYAEFAYENNLIDDM